MKVLGLLEKLLCTYSCCPITTSVLYFVVRIEVFGSVKVVLVKYTSFPPSSQIYSPSNLLRQTSGSGDLIMCV